MSPEWTMIYHGIMYRQLWSNRLIISELSIRNSSIKVHPPRMLSNLIVKYVSSLGEHEHLCAS